MPRLSTDLKRTDSPSVAVLEWVCGGGLLATPKPNIPQSLVAEGEAMLLTLVEGLSAAGIDVVVPVDSRLLAPSRLARIDACAQAVVLNSQLPTAIADTWHKIAVACDWSWLVAPELGDRLTQIAAELRGAGVQLLNADQDFLRSAGNKLICAELWREACVPHPPTRLLCDITQSWLDACQSGSHLPSATGVPSWGRHADLGTSRPRLWVAKPMDGAGGENLEIVTREELLRMRDGPTLSRGSTGPGPTAEKMIVQPWLSGIAASCTAIVDPNGVAWWLPLVSQDFATLGSRRYIGCSYPAPGISSSLPIDLLHKTLRALPGSPLGWIGVDLLYDPERDQWWVIEVNPRCTTSLVGLSAAYRGNLVGQLLGLQTGSLLTFVDDFAPFSFRLGSVASGRLI